MLRTRTNSSLERNYRHNRAGQRGLPRSPISAKETLHVFQARQGLFLISNRSRVVSGRQGVKPETNTLLDNNNTNPLMTLGSISEKQSETPCRSERRSPPKDISDTEISLAISTKK
jgi:hypothetical protein